MILLIESGENKRIPAIKILFNFILNLSVVTIVVVMSGCNGDGVGTVKAMAEC